MPMGSSSMTTFLSFEMELVISAFIALVGVLLLRFYWKRNKRLGVQADKVVISVTHFVRFSPIVSHLLNYRIIWILVSKLFNSEIQLHFVLSDKDIVLNLVKIRLARMGLNINGCIDPPDLSALVNYLTSFELRFGLLAVYKNPCPGLAENLLKLLRQLSTTSSSISGLTIQFGELARANAAQLFTFRMSNTPDVLRSDEFQLRQLYDHICQLRDAAVAVGEMENAQLYAPDIILREMLKLRQAGVGNMVDAVSCEIPVIARNNGTSDAKEGYGADYSRSNVHSMNVPGLGLISKAKTSSRHRLVYASLALLCLLGSFLLLEGLHSKSTLKPNFTEEIESLSRIERAGLAGDLADLYQAQQKLRSYNRELTNCKHCDEKQKAAWDRYCKLYLAAMTKFLDKRIYSEIAILLEQNEASKPIIDLVYLHFKQQSDYLKSKEVLWNYRFSEMPIGKLMYFDTQERMQLAQTYALYLLLIKQQRRDLHDYELGMSLLSFLLQRPWFVKTLKDTNNLALPQTDLSKQPFTRFLLDADYGEKNYIYHPNNLQTVNAILSQLDPYPNSDTQSLTRQFLNDYVNFWFHCVPNNVSHAETACRIPINPWWSETLGGIRQLLQPILPYSSWLTASNKAKVWLLNALVDMNVVLGRGHDGSGGFNGLFNKAKKKIAKYGLNESGSLLTGLLENIEKIERDIRQTVTWDAWYEKNHNNSSGSIPAMILDVNKLLGALPIEPDAELIKTVMRRQLNKYLGYMRGEIVQAYNHSWRNALQSYPSGGSLAKRLENSEKLFLAVNTPLQLNANHDEPSNEMFVYLQPRIRTEIATAYRRALHLRENISAIDLDIDTRPAQSYTGDLVTHARLILNCAPEPVILSNHNFKKHYHIQLNLGLCSGIRIEASVNHSECLAEARDAIDIYRSLQNLLADSELELHCGNGQLYRAQLGFVANNKVISSIEQYISQVLPDTAVE